MRRLFDMSLDGEDGLFAISYIYGIDIGEFNDFQYFLFFDVLIRHFIKSLVVHWSVSNCIEPLKHLNTDWWYMFD